MAEKTVMDEVNAALGDSLSGEDPPEPVVTEEEIPEGDEPEGEIPEGDESEGEESEGEEAEGEEKPEGEVGPNGERERNADGTWKAKTEAKLDKDGKPIVEPKKADPVNDPIPKDLKKDTQERIRTLIDTTKTVTAERDTIKQNFDYMVNGIQQTGASPQQYGETLSWLALFNSGDPKQQEKALELVETVAERLATLLGRERTVGDPLGQHADLKEAVAKGQITAQYAKEIARTRNGQAFRTEIATNASQEQQQQQQAAEEERQGRAALTELERTLIASDPDYAAKKAILVPALKPLMVSIPWSQRKDRFLEAYKNIRIPKPTVNGAVKTPANQPLRAGKQPAGGQTKQPSSMLEAISGALGSMGK
jgi:hypothetical protein